MKTEYTRAYITNLLLQNGYKPTVTKDSGEYDVYTKKGSPKIALQAELKTFQAASLKQILTKELLGQIQ